MAVLIKRKGNLMPTVAAPKHDITHPEADIECQSALQPAFQELLRESVRAGWDESLASRALIGLASANLKEIVADGLAEDTDLEALARSTP